MSNILIVDRIEAGIAVCEGEGSTFVQVPLSSLPKNVREGDCLRPTPDGYIIDRDETTRRRALNKRLFDMLKKPNNNN